MPENPPSNPPEKPKKIPTELVRGRTQTALAMADRTSTPSVTPSATPLTPTRTPTVTLTPTDYGQPVGEKYCVNVRSVYVRAGPGSSYAAMGGLTFEDCLYFDSRVEHESLVEAEEGPTTVTTTWVQISASQPAYAELEGGWVRADLLRPDDYSLLPIITLTPSLTPSPEPSPTPTPLG